jgi:hypothetical protein
MLRRVLPCLSCLTSLPPLPPLPALSCIPYLASLVLPPLSCLSCLASLVLPPLSPLPPLSCLPCLACLLSQANLSPIFSPLHPHGMSVSIWLLSPSTFPRFSPVLLPLLASSYMSCRSSNFPCSPLLHFGYPCLPLPLPTPLDCVS